MAWLTNYTFILFLQTNHYIDTNFKCQLSIYLLILHMTMLLIECYVLLFFSRLASVAGIEELRLELHICHTDTSAPGCILDIYDFQIDERSNVLAILYCLEPCNVLKTFSNLHCIQFTDITV